MTTSVDDVADNVLAIVGPTEAMKLQKLVYYVQAWHVAATNEPMFSNAIEAWVDGPVVDRLYQQHRGVRTVHAWPSGDRQRLTDFQRELVRTVCGVYGALSGDNLSALTHAEEPWREAREGYGPNQRSRRAISLASMRRFYGATTLAGRYPSDLAIGGLEYVNLATADPDEVRDQFASLIERYNVDVGDVPGDDAVLVPCRAFSADEEQLRSTQGPERRVRPTR